MKIKYLITISGGEKEEVYGNFHILKLCSGEKIKVASHKDGDWGWHITDIETGLNLVPLRYYGFIFYEDYGYGVDTERNALNTAKFNLDKYLKEHNTTFSERREKRLKEILDDN